MQNVWAASNGPHTFYTPLIEASWCSKRGGTRPPRGKSLFRSVVRYRSAGGAARARTHRILRALRFDLRCDLRCGPRRGGHRRGAEGAAIDSDGSSLAPAAPWRFQKGQGWRCPSSGARRRRSGRGGSLAPRGRPRGPAQPVDQTREPLWRLWRLAFFLGGAPCWCPVSDARPLWE